VLSFVHFVCKLIKQSLFCAQAALFLNTQFPCGPNIIWVELPAALPLSLRRCLQTLASSAHATP
jgi:hypothetical protein